MYQTDRFKRKKEYLKYALPYAKIFHEPAIVLNKDGSLQATWKYRGPDLNSAIKEQLAIITQQLIWRLWAWTQAGFYISRRRGKRRKLCDRCIFSRHNNARNGRGAAQIFFGRQTL